MNTKDVAASFQLISTSIRKLNISNSFYEYSEHKDGERTVDLAYDIVDQRYVEEKNKRMGLLDLHISLLCKVVEEGFTIEMVLRGVFQAEPEISEETFTHMLRLNGCAALYSIARASVSSISTQLFSIGNIVLPMVNFVRFHELDTGE